MSPLDEPKHGKLYWRSLEDLADTPEFKSLVEREFPSYADEILAPSRRGFLKVMGASIALAGATACRRWPVEKIVPFANRPEGFVPGATAQYATAMDIAGSGLGLLVTSHDGRPIKVEGNPLHPQSLGATNAHAQASVLELYDPDRSRQVLRIEAGKESAATWDDATAFLVGIIRRLRPNGGKGLHVLADASSSPSRLDMRSRLLRAMPGASWHEYEPLSLDNERQGSILAFGKPCRTQLALDQARVIISLDADLLMTHPAAVRHARDFASGRRAVDGKMNRLYVVETGYSITGAMADHRLPTLARMVPVVAGRLAAELFLKGRLAFPAGTEGIRPVLERFALNPFHPFQSPLVASMARDLLESRGSAIVAAGPRQPAEVHALVHLMNAALENAGRTVLYTHEPDGDRPSHIDSMRTLVNAMGAGSVDTLLILGGNPVFNAPSDLGFERHLAMVRNTVHLGLSVDETSRACRWHLPQAHFLESWGDARGWDGTFGVVQPLIEPLYEGMSSIELLALLLEEPPTKGYEIVRRTLGGFLDPNHFEKSWRRVLHDGVLEGSRWPSEEMGVRLEGWTEPLSALADTSPSLPGGCVEVVFTQDMSIHDGRFANNGWLQELSDPLTKLTWDNAALVSPALAKDMKLKQGDIVRIRQSGLEAELPVFIQPGQAEGSISAALGYGRRYCGRVGDGVGVDMYRFRTSPSMHAAVAEIEKTGRQYELATTQDHHVIDSLGMRAREIRVETLVRQGEIEEYLEHPEFAKHRTHVPPLLSLWEEHRYEGHKWGMSIDLTACIGCNACSIACQAENNIPVVGKQEVARGREMHWLRVDRYFSGAPETPAVAFQPLTCQHCENAPCEQVCPVGATVHDSEGLNVMVYNRCIGTRYCANNCPYKVRRFNWLNNHKHKSSLELMILNPEVSVRSRGVMEKCTFCIQRIDAVKIEAKNDGRSIRDGEITPACAQACPTEAIVFGDLNDRSSRVRGLQEHPRAYALLEELNVKPRTRYLARLRNRGGSPKGAEGGAS